MRRRNSRAGSGKRILAAVLAAGLFLSLPGCRPLQIPGKWERKGQTAVTGAPLPETEIRDASERSQYDIALSVDAPSAEDERRRYTMLTLHETVSFRNDSESDWSELCLRDYAQMSIEECRDTAGSRFGKDTALSGAVDHRSGTSCKVRRDRDKTVVYLALPEPLRSGEQMALSFDFTFPVSRSDVGGARTNYKYVNDDGVNPVFALGNFYPVLAAWKNGGWVTSPDIPAGGECFLSPVADYHVTVSVPENWQVIGTGDEEQVSSADGRTSFEVTAEKVRDCALVFSSGLSMAEEKTEGILVRAWYYEGREEDKEVLLTSAVRAVEAFTKEFGPYPYDSIDVAETGLFAGGMEYPQLVFISDDLWDYDWYAPRFLLNSTFGITTAHEVAHNWFYAAVGNDEYNDSWLDESFASYCEYVYRMYISDIGEGEPFTWVEAEIDAKKGFYEEEPDPFIDLSAGDMDYYIETVYGKGCYFLVQLRRVMGEKAFREALREYYSTYCLGIASTEDFVRILRPYLSGNEEAVRLCRRYLSRFDTDPV